LVSPSVVFADEPTAALDRATGRSTMAVLTAACRDASAALLVVTHDPEVAQCCDRVVHMRDGRISEVESNPAVRRDLTAAHTAAHAAAVTR
jgi:putative ABC transport system ATP-binding protein